MSKNQAIIRKKTDNSLSINQLFDIKNSVRKTDTISSVKNPIEAPNKTEETIDAESVVVKDMIEKTNVPKELNKTAFRYGLTI